MKHRDLTNNPEQAIVDLDSSTGPEYTPNMDHGSIFRVDDTVNVTINDTVNLRDGQYIRLEIKTGAANTITFGTQYTIDGSVISPVTNSNGLYILEGRYSTVNEKLLMRIV